MTERFDAEAQQTTQGQSGVGPSITVTSLTALGVGQGSGQSATAQERNSSIAFEFPIRWDDISANLARLDQKKYLEEVVDDMTTRDQQLENFLNTNVVSGIVAGSNITISRATGVVTITAGTPAWTAWTPTIVTTGSTVTMVSNASRYVQIGKTIHARLQCKVTLSVSDTILGYRLPVNNYDTTLSYEPSIGTYYNTSSSAAEGGVITMPVNAGTTDYVKIRRFAANNSTTWELGSTVTYEAA